MHLIIAIALLGFIVIPYPAKADANEGRIIIRDHYAQLMATCAQAAQDNRSGQSYFATLPERVDNLVRKGNTRKHAQQVMNGLAWAMRKECSNVW